MIVQDNNFVLSGNGKTAFLFTDITKNILSDKQPWILKAIKCELT